MPNIEDLEDQLTIKPPPEGPRGGKYEALCHICPWTFFRDTDELARELLRQHITEAHLAPGAYSPPSMETGQTTSGWIKKTE